MPLTCFPIPFLFLSIFHIIGLCVDAFRLGLRDGLRLPGRPHSALNSGQRRVLITCITSLSYCCTIS